MRGRVGYTPMVRVGAGATFRARKTRDQRLLGPWRAAAGQVSIHPVQGAARSRVDLARQDARSDQRRAALPVDRADRRASRRSCRGGKHSQIDLFQFDRATGRQSGGWTNKLIWGDNKLVLSSLKNGPLRREIENAGGLKLVYIDPPFDVGAD